ncbi:MAG TPA: ergothioneine biosynthesis protein EgtB [Granulicella sp.]|nr:ergothioneine biosynthesis protein EgtB [Granulicella sp.]
MPIASAPTIPALLARYRTVRAATLELTAPLTPEDLMVQSCPEASPVKWHLAHTSWFFETFVLSEFLPAYQPFHPDFRWLFNSYYNALGDMPEKKLRSSFSRPPLDAILAYRAHVDLAIARLLELAPLPAEAARRITLGLEHEQQHQELIATDIKHALFTNPLHPAYREPSPVLRSAPQPEAIAPPLEWIHYPGGLTQIGITPSAEAPTENPDAFAFDNESPRHTVYLHPFALASRLVTCAEYLGFLDDSGYTRPELWLSEGWTRMREEGWKAPLYWQQDPATASGWCIYTLHGLTPLEQLSETPVCHLSFFEADAYARWFSLSQPGHRLPTEFEWEHAASLRSPDQIASAANLLETNNLHPTPAPSRPGLQQIFGDTWEWTSSGYTGYPGYQPLPGALGEYNGKFMSSQIVLRGGSCVTPATHIRATYRNFFPPATRWQFSGLRLAK